MNTSLFSTAFILGCLLVLSTYSEATSQHQDSNVQIGKHSFAFKQWAGPSINVWAYKPSAYNGQSKILIVMHGTNRDADRYRDEWTKHAEKNNILLIVPQFTKEDFPKAIGYNLGNVFVASSNYTQTNPANEWAYSVIEPLFDFVKSKYQSSQSTYNIYGHSAGSQFVHRFIFFVPEARVAKIITANAGWYTAPDFSINFPYGLNNTPVSEENLKQALQKPVTILLGEADKDPNHKSLRRAKEAMLQGPHRFARGHHFYASAQQTAKALNIQTQWELITVPKVGHKNGLMADAAIEILVR